MAQKPIITKDTPPDLLEKDIAMTRKKMSSTIGKIEERFSLEHLKGVAKETIREKINSAADRGKELAGRAKKSALGFGRAAGDRSVIAKDSALQYMRNDRAAARILAFQLGAWSVIALKSLLGRRRKEARGPGYAKAKIMSIEEVERKVENAAMTPESEIRKAA